MIAVLYPATAALSPGALAAWQHGHLANGHQGAGPSALGMIHVVRDYRDTTSGRSPMLANQDCAREQVGTWDLDRTTGTLRCSLGFGRLFGLSAAASLDISHFMSLLTMDDRTQLSLALDRCFATRTDLHMEVRGPSENPRWIELRAELQTALDGATLRLVGMALDITQRRQEQGETHRTALLLQAVLENASGLIYAKDYEGRILIANPPTLQLIGRPWEEVRGRTDMEFLADPAQGRAVMANDRRIMDSGRTEVLEEKVGCGERLKTWLSTKTPLRDEVGQTIGLVGISQDITERKAAEEQLLHLNATLEARVAEQTRERDSAWNRSQDMLLVLDGAGIFKAVNPAWTTVLGWERDELVEHSVLEFIHPDDYAGTLEALAHAGSAVISKYENRYRHKDGTYRWIEWNAAPEGNRIHASGRHVTAQKEAELALAAKTAQLEVTNKELESFSYSVSHDLRAPLRAIDGFGAMLEEDYAARLDEEGRRLLLTIRDSSRRMGRLIDDLLAFSRLAHVPLATNEVDTDSLVKDVIKEISGSTSGRAVTFDVGPLAAVRGDPGLLRQVWLNLLSNATKYSAKELAPRVEIRNRQEEAQVIFSIRDNGVGFDMKYEDKLFGVFQRLHSATEFDGTGVGLAIVHRILTRHGGRIWANGTPGQGAEFFFALPANYA